MRLGSNDPIEPSIAPTTHGGINNAVVGLMGIVLVLGAALFWFIGAGSKVPVAPNDAKSPTPVATTFATASPNGAPTPSSASTAKITEAGSCLVASQVTCDNVAFGEYQPGHSAAFRVALLRPAAGSTVHAPADGVVTMAEAATYLDSAGQPVRTEDAYLEITGPDKVIYMLIFQRSASSISMGQTVSAGDSLGDITGNPLALSTGATNLAFAIMTPGTNGLPQVDVERMRALFPEY